MGMTEECPLGLGFGAATFNCVKVEGCCARLSCQIVCPCLASMVACCSSETTGAARAYKVGKSMAKVQEGGGETASDPDLLCLEEASCRGAVQTHIQPVAYLVILV